MPVGLPGGKVLIANQGQESQGRYVQDPFDLNKRMQLKLLNFGESYRVCCPWCGDRTHRLWINHRWGVYDPMLGRANFRLLKCFNEDCHQDSRFIDEMRNRVEDLSNMIGPKAVPKLQLNVPAAELSQMELPGECISFKDLPDSNPGAIFLRNRGYNPKKLSTYFKIGWCPSSKFKGADHRILVPLTQNNKLVGWQARFVDSYGNGDTSNLYKCSNELCSHSWRHTENKPSNCPQCGLVDPVKILKWYTGPGTKKSSILYNFDIARSYRYVVVMEGAGDVWRLGSPHQADVPGPGVCAFGHKLSQQQIQLLEPLKSSGIVFLAFDTDVWDETIKQYIELYKWFPERVVPVVLPKDKDPGDMKHSDIWDSIRDCCVQLNVKVPF